MNDTVRSVFISETFLLYTVAMNKARLEALSDGVFAIVMTLLIFDIKVPLIPGEVTNQALWIQLGVLWRRRREKRDPTRSSLASAATAEPMRRTWKSTPIARS